MSTIKRRCKNTMFRYERLGKINMHTRWRILECIGQYKVRCYRMLFL